MINLHEKIEDLIKDAGLQVFEVELPRGRVGVLRVFISKSKESASVNPQSADKTSVDSTVDSSVAKVGGITHDDCVLTSRRISEFLESSEAKSQGLDSDGWTLEVSSPGINRRLTRESHFAGAVGERVKVTLRPHEQSEPGVRASSKNVVYGILESFEHGKVTVREEDSQELCSLPLAEVREARTEFKFTTH